MTEGLLVTRIYLYVPPEEKAEVKGLGAVWDTQSMCWYIDSNEDPSRFTKWLAVSEECDEFSVVSARAFVASAKIACGACDSQMQVICIHCKSGTCDGDPLQQFTISDVWRIDEALAGQLRPWPNFRKVDASDSEESHFANHCPRCGVPMDDLYLHSEPGEPFFNVPATDPGSVQLTPLVGQIQLSGNVHYQVD